MKSGKWARVLRSALVLAVLGACGPLTSATPAPSEAVPPAAFTAIPTFTAAPPTRPPATLIPPTQAPATQPAETSLGKMYVTVTADNVNLRTRPGTVFPVSRLLAKGTRLQLLGHAPGNEWLYVQTDSKIQGWVLFWLVSGGHDGGPTPEVTPGDVLVVRGKVVDRAGVPVSGIGFAVTQGKGPAGLRTDANTDETGQFYAYLPSTASGTWLVTYTAISCTSNTMDANCNCIGTCGTSDPQSTTISMPPSGVLEFVWR